MYDYDEMKQSLRLVEAAIVLLDEAEDLNGQPLYYDEEGNSVDIVEVLKYTARSQREFLAEEGQLEPLGSQEPCRNAVAVHDRQKASIVWCNLIGHLNHHSGI